MGPIRCTSQTSGVTCRYTFGRRAGFLIARERYVLYRVNLGIISTADINRKVIPGAHASKKVDLVAVASRKQERAEAYAREWKIERAYGSYEELLADPDIDAVYISLPNTMHAEWSITAVEAGKHVLCEKPLTRHPDEVDARVRRRRPREADPDGGVHVPAQPADEAPAAS